MLAQIKVFNVFDKGYIITPTLFPFAADELICMDSPQILYMDSLVPEADSVNKQQVTNKKMRLLSAFDR